MDEDAREFHYPEVIHKHSKRGEALFRGYCSSRQEIWLHNSSVRKSRLP